jgi:uncharacterized protein (UPF0333 family)
MLYSEEKGQTALETLLIIAAAVILAAVVGLYLKSLPPRIEHKAKNQTNQIINNI